MRGGARERGRPPERAAIARPALACSLVLCLAAAAPAPLAQQPAVVEAVEARRFARAHELALAEEAPVERRLALAFVSYRAGDPARALAEAEAGLKLSSAHLRLLHRACAASLWLALAEPAAEYARRLEAAVEDAPLDPEERDAWRASARDYARQAEGLLAAAHARHVATGRARTVVLATLAGALLALGALVLRAGRADRSGSRRRSGS